MTPLSTSIARKGIMAVSGFLLVLFLLLHLLGNSTLFFGRAAFNSYAAHLHALDRTLVLFEVLLFLAFLVHIITGLRLYLENRTGRPVRHAVRRRPTSRSLLAGTMPYTGLVILIFLAIHLADFHFAPASRSPADLLTAVLGRPEKGILYLAGVIGVALHIGHGSWSMFQSLGLTHPRYEQTLVKGAAVFSVLTMVIFGLIPLLILLPVLFPC